MTNAKMLELAERCEQATGADFDLSQEIYDFRVAEGFVPDRSHLPYPGYHYTASLDAAMTLVPEGWFWRVGHSTLYEGWAATNRVHPDHCNREDETFAKAATPALALCAAALRATKDREAGR